MSELKIRAIPRDAIRIYQAYKIDSQLKLNFFTAKITEIYIFSNHSNPMGINIFNKNIN
jgi:hypothetical protein